MRFTDNMKSIQKVELPVIETTVVRILQDRFNMNLPNVKVRIREESSYMNDYISEELAIELRARLVSQELCEVKYPADWWEAFKERWAPQWLLKKYPVKYTVYNAKALYTSIAIPDEQYVVHFYKQREDS